MSLLNKLTIKNLRLNKKRTIVTIIGIILSVALITAVAAFYFSGIKSLTLFEINRSGNFHAVFYEYPVKDLSVLENNRNIETINIVQNIGYAKIDSKNNSKPYAYLKSFSEKALSNLSVRMVSGRLPLKEDEIIIPTHLETNGRVFLNIGDEITLNVGRRVSSDGKELNQSSRITKEEMLIDTVPKTYKVVGIMERPANNIENFSAPGYSFITYSNENEINSVADVYVKYYDNKVRDSYITTANILGIDAKLFDKVSRDDDSVSKKEYDRYYEELQHAKYMFGINKYLVNMEIDPISGSGIKGLENVVYIIIIIIVVTSVFCIKNSFDISITEKTKQYGILKSIGATKKQIKKNVFYEASVLGIIGIPLGVALGLLAAYILVIVSKHYLGIMMVSSGLELVFDFSWIAILVAIVLGIITIYFSAFRSATRASKISPIESIRNSANIKINAKKIKTPGYIKNLFGIGGEISLKNIKRNKKKYRTTIISLITSVFVFIALSGFMGSAFKEVDHELRVSDYNISLTAIINDDVNIDKYIETTKFDNIKDYVILRYDEVLVSNARYSKKYREVYKGNSDCHVEVLALGEKPYQKYLSQLGYNYLDMKDKAILLDSDTVTYPLDNGDSHSEYMRILDYQKNDVINAKLDDKNISFKVGLVTDTKPFGLKHTNGLMLIVSDSYFDQNIKTKIVNILYESTDANKLQNDIEEYINDKNYTINNNNENVQIMRNLFTLIGIFLYGFIIVISLIGITNIFNTITTSMQLRKREFAMLKSIGMTNKEFNHMIRLESLFIGFKSLFYGIGIGIVLSYIINHYLVHESGLPYELPITAIIISIVVVFILISLIMKYSINKISKQNTIETIRNENI